jgi:transcription antitermination factor NusG
MESQSDLHLEWYALYLRSRHEKKVANHLRMQGYEVCLPVYRSLREWCDRQKVVDMPAFPGYLFCRFDRMKRTKVLDTQGVVYIVGNHDGPLPLDPSEVAALQTLERSNSIFEPWPYVGNGDSVRIEGGSLDGLTGIVLDSRRITRVIVSVSLLQRSVAIEVDRVRLVPLTPTPRATVASSLLAADTAIRQVS